jgi:biopolymer transport protein ExbD
MSWKVRHEGSPRAVEGLTPGQIAQGLVDGHWEPTDEVMGPDDPQWVAIENHPVFAEAAMDLDPPEVKSYDDETRLDMNALIDVCLVLLVFFILTTSYAALQRLIDMPGMSIERVSGAPKVTKEAVERLMIKVEVRMVRGGEGAGEKDVPVIKVEGETVEPDQVGRALARFVKDTRKTELLIDYSPRVPYGTVIGIQDAAAGAGIQQVHILVPKEELDPQAHTLIPKPDAEKEK